MAGGGALKPKKVVETYSAGVKLAMVARGEVDLYVNTYANFSDWDICAGDMLVTEAGGMVTEIAGTSVRYGTPGNAQTRGPVGDQRSATRGGGGGAKGSWDMIPILSGHRWTGSESCPASFSGFWYCVGMAGGLTDRVVRRAWASRATRLAGAARTAFSKHAAACSRSPFFSQVSPSVVYMEASRSFRRSQAPASLSGLDRMSPPRSFPCLPFGEVLVGRLQDLAELQGVAVLLGGERVAGLGEQVLGPPGPLVGLELRPLGQGRQRLRPVGGRLGPGVPADQLRQQVHGLGVLSSVLELFDPDQPAGRLLLDLVEDGLGLRLHRPVLAVFEDVLEQRDGLGVLASGDRLGRLLEVAGHPVGGLNGQRPLQMVVERAGVLVAFQEGQDLPVGGRR